MLHLGDWEVENTTFLELMAIFFICTLVVFSTSDATGMCSKIKI